MKIKAVLFSILSISLIATSARAQDELRHVKLVSIATASGNQVVVLPSQRVAPIARPRLATRLAGASFPMVSARAGAAKPPVEIGPNEEPTARDGVTEPLAPGQTVILGATGGTTRVSTGIDTLVVTAPAWPR